MLSYEDLKTKPKTLIAMTSLKRMEFEELLALFTLVWEKERDRTSSKGGRPPNISNDAARLLFILFYLKTYPLQEVIGHLFGLSQSQINVLIHQLSDILKKALANGGHKPPRLTEEMLTRLETEASQDMSIDGTERRINRPVDSVGQRLHYSGKKSHLKETTLLAVWTIGR